MTDTPTSGSGITAPSAFTDAGGGFFGSEVHAAGPDLSEAVRAVLADVGLSTARAVDVAERLKIDKTLAWRLTKVAETAYPLSALASSPAPAGLRILLRSALKHGLSDAGAAALERAIGQLERVIGLVPEGRSGLISAIAGATSQSEAADREARRKIYQGAMHVFGMRIGVGYSCEIITPSATDPMSCDSATVSGWAELRRVRPGSPMLLTAFASALAGDESAARWAGSFRTLENEHSDDFGDYVLPEFSTQPLPALDIEPRDRQVLVRLPGELPSLTDSVDLFMAHRSTETYMRYAASEDKPYVFNRYASRSARKVWISDLLLHEDAFPGAQPPFMTFHLGGLGALSGIGYTPEDSLDTLDSQAKIEHAGRGIDGLYSPHLPQIRDVLRSTFQKLGYDERDYTAWRFVMEFAVPGTVAVRWIRLSPKPE
ncbi:MAG: hypothetical protein ACFCBV_04680 [Phycisphaerales bacterium]